MSSCFIAFSVQKNSIGVAISDLTNQIVYTNMTFFFHDFHTDQWFQKLKELLVEQKLLLTMFNVAIFSENDFHQISVESDLIKSCIAKLNEKVPQWQIKFQNSQNTITWAKKEIANKDFANKNVLKEKYLATFAAEKMLNDFLEEKFLKKNVQLLCNEKQMKIVTLS